MCCHFPFLIVFDAGIMSILCLLSWPWEIFIFAFRWPKNRPSTLIFPLNRKFYISILMAYCIFWDLTMRSLESRRSLCNGSKIKRWEWFIHRKAAIMVDETLQIKLDEKKIVLKSHEEKLSMLRRSLWNWCETCKVRRNCSPRIDGRFLEWLRQCG